MHWLSPVLEASHACRFFTRTERTLRAQAHSRVQDLQTGQEWEGNGARWRWCAPCSLKLAQPMPLTERKTLVHRRRGRNAVQAAEGEAGRAGAGAL